MPSIPKPSNPKRRWRLGLLFAIPALLATVGFFALNALRASELIEARREAARAGVIFEPQQPVERGPADLPIEAKAAFELMKSQQGRLRDGTLSTAQVSAFMPGLTEQVHVIAGLPRETFAAPNRGMGYSEEQVDLYLLISFLVQLGQIQTSDEEFEEAIKTLELAERLRWAHQADPGPITALNSLQNHIAITSSLQAILDDTGSSLIAERILSLLDARQPAAPSVESLMDALVQAGVGRIRSVDQPESLIASEAVWPAELPLSSRWTKAAPRESVIVHIRRMLGQYPAGSVMMLRRDAAEIRLLNFAASVKRGGPFNDPSRLIERLKQVYDPTKATAVEATFADVMEQYASLSQNAKESEAALRQSAHRAARNSL